MAIENMGSSSSKSQIFHHNNSGGIIVAIINSLHRNEGKCHIRSLSLFSLLTSSYTIEQLKNWLFVEQFYVYRIYEIRLVRIVVLLRGGGALV